METRMGGNGRGALRESLLHGANVTSMLPTVHKQGYLGDLHEKSTPELTDLLERQEKLLRNRKFVDRLPDKGEKIRKFAKTLQDVIAEKESNKDSHVMSENNGSVGDVRGKKGEDNGNAMEEDQDHEIKHEEELKIIERGFEQLSVHEGPHYQVVVKAEERTRKKSKFSLNRPQKSDAKDPSPSKSESSHPKSSTTELTSASIHDPEHGPATLISVGECRTLYSTQQKKMQETRAEQFAERMLKRFNTDHPEGSYRPKNEAHDNDDLLDPEQDFLDSVD